MVGSLVSVVIFLVVARGVGNNIPLASLLLTTLGNRPNTEQDDSTTKSIHRRLVRKRSVRNVCSWQQYAQIIQTIG